MPQVSAHGALQHDERRLASDVMSEEQSVAASTVVVLRFLDHNVDAEQAQESFQARRW